MGTDTATRLRSPNAPRDGCVCGVILNNEPDLTAKRSSIRPFIRPTTSYAPLFRLCTCIDTSTRRNNVRHGCASQQTTPSQVGGRTKSSRCAARARRKSGVARSTAQGEARTTSGARAVVRVGRTSEGGEHEGRGGDDGSRLWNGTAEGGGGGTAPVGRLCTACVVGASRAGERTPIFDDLIVLPDWGYPLASSCFALNTDDHDTR